MANRLIREKSPYLLQHAHNPVDWYPWADEAFAEAKASDRPIFLSIGYSTCHWCHVMERESFENAQVAELLNQWFVPVKVDREERPDVDRLYMTAMQAMGMGGGWPLNCFLTPDREPFFGGTYFPPDRRFGRPGMVDLLPRVHQAWLEQREQLRATGRRVIEALASDTAAEDSRLDPAEVARVCFATLARHHDAAQGGFGGAPKFPSIPNLHFLFRHGANVSEARAMALRQLDAMRAGGIHDHLGGGFHRYATDANWLVPHFEKMLYDQAQIAASYLDAFQVTGVEAYAATARGIFEYVLRDLLSPAGAFDSAEDADSEGEEGTFYVWTPEQLAAAAGEDAAIFGHRYGVTAGGNFEHGASILHEAHSIEETAERFGIPSAAAALGVERAAARLLEARGRRVRPHRDDKVIAAWNGLMIAAFARGARILGESRYRDAAERAATFVWERLRDPETGELRRLWRDGESAGHGQLDDHAYLALGLIELYSATFDPLWLERAVALTEAMIARFEDVDRGGFFDSPAGDPHVAVRMKSDYDGAEPAANSIAAAILWTLGTLLDRRAWLEKAERTFAAFAPRLNRTPNAMPQMIAAMEHARSRPRHVVIAGDPAAADTRAMVAEANRRFLPHDLVLLADGGAGQRRLAALAPFAGPLGTRDGRATAYVCVDFACRLPTTDPSALAAQLDEAVSPPAQESPIP